MLLTELLTACALVLVLEGALYALFPQPMKKAALILVSQPEDRLRFVGVGIATLGVAWVWLIRHF